jgi:hypothetical protein
MFRMTFPAITAGLSILLCVLHGMHWKGSETGSPVDIPFWRRIFAVGVVAGIVLAFSTGLLSLPDRWRAWCRATVRSSSGRRVPGCAGSLS